MEKYQCEAGLNQDGAPVIKCSPAFYNELIKECRKMIVASIEMGTHNIFARTYPAIGLIGTLPATEEIFNVPQNKEQC